MHDNLRGQSTIGRSSVAHPGPFSYLEQELA